MYINSYLAIPGIIILVIYTLVVANNLDLDLYSERLLPKTVDNNMRCIDDHGWTSLSESRCY